MTPSTTTRIIDEIVAVQDAGGPRERYYLRQVLHSLVRQARAELLVEMRANTRRLAGWELVGGRMGEGAPRGLPCDEGGTGD